MSNNSRRLSGPNPQTFRPQFRTFNVIDHFNREGLAIEVDTSLTGPRVIRVFEQLKPERGLPEKIRVDNGPEFTGSDLKDWAEDQGIEIEFIEPGKPNQNAFIERFNRTYREEVLDLWLFSSLDQVPFRREVRHGSGEIPPYRSASGCRRENYGRRA